MDLNALIKSVLTASNPLTNLLTGGIWCSDDKINGQPIVSMTPKQYLAFDSINRVKSSIYFRIETINPLSYSDQTTRVAYLTLFVYQADKRIDELLQNALVSLEGQQNIFGVKLATIQPEKWEQSLGCLFSFYRYQITYSLGEINV